MPDSQPDIVAETPAGAEKPTKLTVYFIVHGRPLGLAPDERPDKVPVDDQALSQFEVSVNIASKEAWLIQKMIPSLVAIVVQTKEGDSQAVARAFAVTGGG